MNIYHHISRYSQRLSHYQAGMTLIELLIALALSSLLLTGIISVVQGNKATLVLADSVVKSQESGRFSLEVLARDIRMAGYGGCINAYQKVVSHLDTTDAQYSAEKHDFTNVITVIDSYTTGVHQAAFGGVTPLENSDVFITGGTVPTDILVSKMPAANATTIQVAGPASQIGALKKGAVVMVTDCNSASVFAISKATAGVKSTTLEHVKVVANGPDNTSDTIGVSYASGSSVMLMNRVAYFIAPGSFGDANSLYRYSTLESSGVAVELIPFIEDLTFTYGVDIDADQNIDSYATGDELIALATAAGVNIENLLVSVQIELITRSEKNVKAAQLTGFPDDGHLRKRFTSVVQIRNAGIGND